jgi:hypothetical protein
VATAASILSTLAPKFSTLDSGRVSSVLELAALQVGSVFGDKRNLATAYLAAHMLEISTQSGDGGSGTGGLVTSEKEGQLSRSYGALGGQAGGGSEYERTVWGMEFLRIRKQCVFRPRTRLQTLPIDVG